MKRLLRHFRDAFVSGLLAIIPIGATFYILWEVYRLINGLVGRTTPFGQMVEKAVGHWIPGMGIYMMLILILLVGLITRNFFGRTVQYYFDRAISSLPGVRKMYITLKKFTNALLNRDTSSFQKVVLFEYPRPGIYVIGLVTNEDLGKLQKATGEEAILVYVPTAPNPLSGMMLLVPRREAIEIDISVEEALSMVISSGSALPDSLREVEPPSPRPRFNLFRWHSKE